MKKIKNPLIRRIPKELIGDWKKYLVVFLFLVLTIGFVSGMYVANESMITSASEGVTKYKQEDGHFELKKQADATLLSAIETGEKADVKQYYLDEAKKKLDKKLPKKFKEKFDEKFPDKFKKEFDKKFPEQFKKSFDKEFKKQFEQSFPAKFASSFKKEFDPKFKQSFDATFVKQFDAQFAAQVKQSLLAQGMDETMAAAMLDTAVAQAKQALTNLSHLLEAAGTSMANVVKTTVFIKEMNDFAAINEVYATFFEGAYPARSCVEVARLPKDVMLEIEAIATK